MRRGEAGARGKEKRKKGGENESVSETDRSGSGRVALRQLVINTYNLSSSVSSSLQVHNIINSNTYKEDRSTEAH